MNIVLDTNAVLYFLGGRLREPLPQAQISISVITEIELLSYPLLSSDSEAEIYDFLADITVIDLSPEIKQQTIQLRRQHRFKFSNSHYGKYNLIKVLHIKNLISLFHSTESYFSYVQQSLVEQGG